jgi:hypothetical protein
MQIVRIFHITHLEFPPVFIVDALSVLWCRNSVNFYSLVHVPEAIASSIFKVKYIRLVEISICKVGGNNSFANQYLSL